LAHIVLTNTNCSWNKGSAAQVVSTTETLRKIIPGANFTLISNYPNLDFDLCEKNNVKVVGVFSKNLFLKHFKLLRYFTLLYYVLRCALWATLSKVRLNAQKLLATEVLAEYAMADLILDLSGDTFSDQKAIALGSVLGILPGILLGKKIAVFSQSIGPFRGATKPIARFCLNQVDLIVIREALTWKYLKAIGVHNASTYLAAEIAFLLKPASGKEVQEILQKEGVNQNERERPLIGIGTNALVSGALKSKSEIYLTLMAKTTDYLVESLNAKIVFISHVIIPPQYGSHDDRYVAENIYQMIRNKKSVKIIKGDYSPGELKGVISQCDLFIGARMHSNIASTSMHVPTIALSWSHKYKGIMRMLEQEQYVCEIGTTTLDELTDKINTAWSNRAEIRRTLASKTPELEESAFHSCKLVKMLLEDNSCRYPIRFESFKKAE